MTALLQAFGRLVCGVTGRHKWRRANSKTTTGPAERYNGDVATITTTYHDVKVKTCRRCGEVRKVKARKGKA